MREALAALTSRGRSFVAAGLTAVVCALLLGMDDLLRVGLLVALLPVVAAFFVGRNRHQLALARTVEPSTVEAGGRARAQLELVNEGRTPTGLLLLEDQVPYALGTRPRFVVDGMRSRWRRKVSYPVSAEVRGRYRLGPLRVRVSDPFGLVALHRSFSGWVDLVVTPRVTPLPNIGLAGSWTGSGDNRPRAFAVGSAEDVTVREYRRGDELRRVHWRSTAKSGELMVRREEQPWQSRATILLDNRESAHRGAGAASSLEAAVSAAASVAAHLTSRGFSVRLLTAGGDERGGDAWHEHDAHVQAGPLLEALAVVGTSRHHRLQGRWASETHPGLVVAVLGALDHHDQHVLGQVVHRGTSAMAICLDVPAWERRAPREEGRRAKGRTGAVGADVTSTYLGSHGWKSVVLTRGSKLTAVWQELGASGRTRVPGTAGAPAEARS